MIAVDVMGGDHAPHVVLQGALAAAKKSIPIVLYGPQDMIYAWLAQHEHDWERYRITVVDAPEVVAMDEDPVSAVRKKPTASLIKAVASVAQGKSSAVISAGNSGALMAAAALIIGRSDGVERPAIAGFLPTMQGSALALDLGANTECRAQHLQQFAHMGSAHLVQMQTMQRPRVGLLSNGHEEGKGSLLVKQAHALLKNDTLNFIGNVEPADVFEHKADVVVCDGFAGNVLLKTMEAVVSFAMQQLDAVTAAKLGTRFACKTPGGALLLGVKQPVIVCHGNADTEAIENALSFAWNVSARNK